MIRSVPFSARLAAAGVVVALAPLVLGRFHLNLLTSVLIFGLAAASLDLLLGYTGLVSLGHAAYFGTGAYAAALLALNVTTNAFAGMVAGVLAGTVLALVVGYLVRKTGGISFLMLTVAFSQITFVIALTWSSVTDGENGLSGIPSASLVGGVALDSSTRLFWYALVAALLAYALLRRIVASPFGRSLQGIRDNPERMRSLGYAVERYKLGAFVLAGAFAGFAGGLYVHHLRFVSPEAVGFSLSAILLLIPIIGGVKTLYGAFLGAAVVIAVRDALSSTFEYWEIVLGLLFILIVYFAPDGIAGLAKRLDRRSVTAGARS